MSGDNIVLFSELPCLTPRGRYDIELFPNFMRLHGKTYDYKIAFDTITRLLLLPKPDDQHILFVVGLEPPIRQGQTRYPFLVLQFPREEEMDVELNLSEEVLRDKYSGQLTKSMSGPTYEVVSSVFKVITDKKITIPGAFKSKSNAHAIKCSIKANDGYMYPLEKAFFFLPKPTVLLRFVDISHVEFARYQDASSSTSSRSFDLKVYTKSAGAEYQFSNIAREEYQGLYNFIVQHKLPIKNIVGDNRTAMDVDDQESEEEEDEEDEDESEEDQDFIPADAEEVAEEFDEDYSSSGSDGEANAEESDARSEGESKKSKKPAETKKDTAPKAKRTKKTKSSENENKPKRATSAFMFFSQAIRPTVMKENPGASFGDIGRIIGQKWKELSEADKQPYLEKERRDKERYESDMSAAKSLASASAGKSALSEEVVLDD